MSTYQLFVCPAFENDFRSLDGNTQAQAAKAIRYMALNPNHPSLCTEKRLAFQRKRSVMSARVNRRYRLIWERMEGNAIALWRIIHHDTADAIGWLPQTQEERWREWRVS